MVDTAGDIWRWHHNISECYYHLQLTVKYRRSLFTEEIEQVILEMTGGSVAYIHADFEPGDYAWIAEIPDPVSTNMLKTFTVPE